MFWGWGQLTTISTLAGYVATVSKYSTLVEAKQDWFEDKNENNDIHCRFFFRFPQRTHSMNDLCFCIPHTPLHYLWEKRCKIGHRSATTALISVTTIATTTLIPTPFRISFLFQSVDLMDNFEVKCTCHFSNTHRTHFFTLFSMRFLIIFYNDILVYNPFFSDTMFKAYLKFNKDIIQLYEYFYYLYNLKWYGV